MGATPYIGLFWTGGLFIVGCWDELTIRAEGIS